MVMSVYGRIRKRLKEYQEGEIKRQDKKLERLKFKAGYEYAKAEIERDRLETKKKIADAKAALHKAELADKKARSKIQDMKGSSDLERIGKEAWQLIMGKPKKKRKSKRKK
jgi:hypothetical protein